MPSQIEKAHVFRALHERPGAFVIPNPWDRGTARVLEGLGFEALATTSAGHAHSLGLHEGTVTRDQAIAHASDIASATSLPVSGDFENGYGDDPEHVAETVRLAIDAGLAGCSIEDATGRPDAPIYEFDLTCARIEAAVSAARAADRPFTLTARAENFLHGRPDIDDTLARLKAFDAAGADVVYAPGLVSAEQIRAVTSAVTCPVNVVMGLQGVQLSLDELAELGVRRVSLGSALSRAAFGAVLRAAREIRDHGTFSFAEDAVSFAELDAMMPRD